MERRQEPAERRGEPGAAGVVEAGAVGGAPGQAAVHRDGPGIPSHGRRGERRDRDREREPRRQGRHHPRFCGQPADRRGAPREAGDPGAVDQEGGRVEAGAERLDPRRRQVGPPQGEQRARLVRADLALGLPGTAQ
jgi:hypothetical protein